MARPWPVSCIEMNSHIETKSGYVFIRRKRAQCMWTDTKVGSERDSLALMVVGIIFMGHFFWVSFGQSF